ncbi:SPOR domain-containing protein [Immundisolibacter sp.]|uniref:SPOR domain-containing protein n=1 Tax=Immundisolibacter sp. TaxID=1934948 RepID=UPI00356A5C1D
MDQARLKYRIVGGVVLLALVAILVPLLNDMRQPQPEGPRAIDIPPEPTDGMADSIPADAPPLAGLTPEPTDIPVPLPRPIESEDGPDVVLGPPPVEPAPTPPPAPASAPRLSAVPEPAPAKPASKPAPKPAPKPAAVAPRPAAPSTPAVQQAWVVQLGVYGNLKTAIDLREKLRKAGHSAFTEEITTPHGKALRVRVGPELDRAKAQTLRDRLQRETGHDGIVMAYP